MVRPDFNKNMRIKDFQSYYWYKKELQQICKKHSLPTTGTKAELTAYIIKLLAGIPVSNIKTTRKIRRKGTLKAGSITPNTSILASGFSLNNEARAFFKSYYGLSRFSFTKSMAIKMRAIETTQDKTATVLDLIDIYEHPDENLSNNAEEQTYQWNNFVKTFMGDDATKVYCDRMTVASILWTKVRDSDQPKQYSKELLKQYQSDIRQYLF
ncbi:SAP domain-containing protein [Leuconostoc gelidum subsp. gasicomitatum]|uniref:SAP domain-containing protein n=1 Tax=Leuconostoc gasicomitatum TaxID=115778 RepID=UPI001CC5F42F|nr:SAP domain-containing protein [Leuconostoc gasicomitatum]MBZ5957756.1 SAP domain-containing protein [Leuconostoc gasicomitatum]MBZ5969775.1 SAP domain-containing protein [Leuconostoc gasicomitatum]